MAPRILAVEYCQLVSIRLDPQNPRLHSKKQIRQIANSIKAFGFNVPLVVDADLQVIAGHGRFLASQLLGMTEVPVIRLEHLSEHQRRAYMIADNRLAQNAEWDTQLLGEQLRVLSEAEIEFNLEVTGFEMGEIHMTIEDFASASHGKDDPADAIPESGAKPPVTQAGDLWSVDRHRIYCGDARDDEAYSSLMRDRYAAAVFSDPPCNDSIYGYVGQFRKIQPPELPMASGEKSGAEFTTFLIEVFTCLARHSADGALQFICVDWRDAPELLATAQQVYTEFTNLCIWVKGAAGQGTIYRDQHELVFVFKSGKGAPRNNIKSDRCRTNVWKHRRVNSSSRSRHKNDLPDLHPTIKPVELVADAILDSTARGDIVLDPFLGSGTTLIAAERTGRVCYGIELDPRYVDTIIRRWQKFTGLEAVHQDTGQTFAQRENEVPDA